MTMGAGAEVAALPEEAGAVAVGAGVVAAGSVLVAGAAEDEDESEPPLTARTACWQEDDRLATFFSRHCKAAEPPVGTLEQ